MPSLRRSLIINFLSTSGATGVQFLVSIFLARLLTPSEIGIFSITVVFVNIAHIFRDFGVASYLQRERKLTPEKIRSAIGVLFTSSWLIAAILFFASNWIARWFNEPGIVPVTQVLAAGFLFIPFAAVTNALLTREYAAGKQAIVNVVGTTTYAVTCLGLATNGFGTMSLAWANLANIVICAVALVPFRPQHAPWLPSFRNWGTVLHFGVGSLLSNSATAINNAIPDVLLGKMGTAHHVGLLSRANSTVAIFTYVAGNTVNYGSVAYFAAAHHKGQALAPLVAHATSLVTGVGWPALALTALLGNEIVLTLYGVGWVECVPAIPALALAAGIAMMFNYSSAVLTALGRPYLSAVPVVLTIVVRIVVGLAVFDGSVKTFAWAICIAGITTLPVMLVQQRRYFDYRLRTMLIAMVPSAIVTLACVTVGTVMLWLIPANYSAPLRLIILIVPLTLGWYGALRMTAHPLLKEVNHIYTAIKIRIFGI
jgi:O-antigen/teichoic acid export membrane protein